MANLKLQIELNKGKRGISLDKLEKVVQEMRRFLVAMSDDIELIDPPSWIGVEFTNGSLGFASEYTYDVAAPKLARFNETIIALARSEFPQTVRRSTANQFFEFASTLEQGEVVDIAVFDESHARIPMQITERTAVLARMIDVLPYRESLGSIQGKIHSLYKESKPHPYFTLRELSTANLIKCTYEVEVYPAIIRALAEIDQVIHVRGAVISDTRGRSIHHVKVNEILLADPYGYEDVQKFFGAERSQ